MSPPEAPEPARPSGAEERRSLAEPLELHVRTLAHYIGERHVGTPEALERAALYIEKNLAGFGYSVRREPYSIGRYEARNLIAETSPVQNRPFLLIGAHYDTVPGSPGADDNASGVAVLIELAGILCRKPPPVPVRLAAFGSEEPPHFSTPEMGSAFHARRVKQAGEDLIGMLSLEMLGYYDDRPGSQKYPPLLERFYPPSGSFLALVSDLGSMRFMRRLRDALAPTGFPIETASLPQWVPGVSLSDHLPFWKEGFRAAMLTDTAMYRNPNYHEPTDTPDTLDYSRMASLTESLAVALQGVSQ